MAETRCQPQSNEEWWATKRRFIVINFTTLARLSQRRSGKKLRCVIHGNKFLKKKNAEPTLGIFLALFCSVCGILEGWQRFFELAWGHVGSLFVHKSVSSPSLADLTWLEPFSPHQKNKAKSLFRLWNAKDIEHIKNETQLCPNMDYSSMDLTPIQNGQTYARHCQPKNPIQGTNNRATEFLGTPYTLVNYRYI